MNKKIAERLSRYHKNGNHQLVIKEGLEALRKYPDDVDIARIVASSLIHPAIDEPEEAYKLLEEMIAKHPDSADIHSALAHCCIAYGGENQKAYDELKKAIELRPNNPEWHALLAMIIDTSQDINAGLEEALGALDKAIMLDPENWTYYHALGMAYWEMSKLQDAKKSFLVALSKIPKNEIVFIRQMQSWIQDIDQNKTYHESRLSGH